MSTFMVCLVPIVYISHSTLSVLSVTSNCKVQREFRFSRESIAHNQLD